MDLDENSVKKWMRDALIGIAGDMPDRDSAADHLTDRACEEYGPDDRLRQWANDVAEEYL